MKMFPGTNLIFIVVSPLVALMEDQVQKSSMVGITAMQISVDNVSDIQQGRCQLALSAVTEDERSFAAPPTVIIT